ncbi:MAG: site-2 protease family protein [Clostridia bacterium]|nr:site-2 protease family protein [Clostridia bacterium]
MNNIFYRIREAFRRNPFFFLLIAYIVFRDITRTGSVFEWLYQKALYLPAIVIGISCHEFAHAFVAFKLGDPTPKLQGRLTLDPLYHFDPYGFFLIFFAGFGWGRPVETNPRYYKNRRLGGVLVSLAGVTTNFILAVVFAFLFKLLVRIGVGGAMEIIAIIVYNTMYLNIILGIFNLIPCPPLDGWNVVSYLFNFQKYEWWYRVNSYGLLILMVLLIFNIPDYIIAFFGTKFISLLF